MRPQPLRLGNLKAPYLAFDFYGVASDIQCFLQRSAAFVPALCSYKMRIIHSSVRASHLSRAPRRPYDATARRPPRADRRFLQPRARHRERENALTASARNLEKDTYVAHAEPLASITFGDLGWEAMQQRSAWDETASCRHTTSSKNLVVLHVYGPTMQSLEPDQGGAWSPARDYGRSLDKVVDRLREFAASRGLPEYESFGPDVPFFIRPEPRRKRSTSIGERGPLELPASG